MTTFVLGSLLRMARKYNTTVLKKSLTLRVKSEFPDSLEAWDATVNTRGRYIIADGNWLLLVDVFRNGDLLSALPALFYCICTELTMVRLVPSPIKYLTIMSQKQIQDGVMAPDGRRTSLAYKDQVSCAVASRSLATAATANTLAWLNPVGIGWSGCMSIYKCNAGRQTVRNSMWGGSLESASLRKWNSDWDNHLCDWCQKKAYESHEQGRRLVWKSLPLHFGLEEWGALHQMENDLVRII